VAAMGGDRPRGILTGVGVGYDRLARAAVKNPGSLPVKRCVFTAG